MSTPPHPLKAMAANRARLIAEKQRLKAEYERRAAEIDDEIRQIDDAMNVVSAAIQPYLCPDCRGSGNRRVCDAAGDMDDEPCPTCKGTGIDPHMKINGDAGA